MRSIIKRLVFVAACLVLFGIAQAQIISSGGSSCPASGPDFNVVCYGAKGNTRRVTDASITSNSGTITSATAGFTSADVGKTVFGIETASSLARVPVGTITTVNSSTSITVSTLATTTANNIVLVWGADDTAAIVAAGQAANAANPKGKVKIPAGGYIFSSLLFDLSYSGSTSTISVEGDGSNITTLYASPAYNMSSTSDNNGMVARFANANNERFSGFTVDGSGFSFSNSAFKYPIFTNTGNSIYSDIDVKAFGNVGGGIALWGASTGYNLRVESMGAGVAGIYVNGGQVDCYACNTTNNGGFGISIANVSGAGNTGPRFRMFGGIVDEEGNDTISVSASTDILFFGVKIFGTANHYGIGVDGTSSVRITNSEITPFGSSGNRGGINVATGGVVYLSESRVDKSNSGIALNNAGTVYDLGGNAITNVSGNAVVGNFANGVTCSGITAGTVTVSGGVVTHC